MLLGVCLLIVVFSERVGRCLTGWSEYKTENFVGNFEVGLCFGVLIFYLLGMSPFNGHAWIGLIVYILPLSIIVLQTYSETGRLTIIETTQVCAKYFRANYKLNMYKLTLL